ncbi:hypothetical protein FIBSPDRAFT_1043919 [Athelia psychrophila]|uniref:Uncharacterized protein n=1 Tax=Athelia psychrophila TaxID=1759441 RepID=A0A166KDT7_9AGAM|nr:hypothetical protein FIBSPDRAFT_1043919 [Fibularhizoctonia sp. CBS 109695]
MHLKNAEAGSSSSAPITQPTFPHKVFTDQLGIAMLHKGGNVEVDVAAGVMDPAREHIIVQLQRLGDIDPDLLLLFKTLAFFDPENIPIDIIVFGAKGVELHLEKPLVVPERKSILRDWLATKLPWTQKTLELPSVNTTSAGVPLELRPLLGSICSERWMRGALRHFEDLSLARLPHGERNSLHVDDLIQQVVLQQSTASHPLGQDPCFALAITLLCGAFQSIGDPVLPQFWPEYEILVPHLMSLAKYDSTAINQNRDEMRDTMESVECRRTV